MAQSSSSSGWEFIDNSSLTHFIPLATDFNVEQVFRPDGESNDAALDSIEHRESVFFGMADLKHPRTTSHFAHHSRQMNRSTYISRSKRLLWTKKSYGLPSGG
jgi:hypothetical protein